MFLNICSSRKYIVIVVIIIIIIIIILPSNFTSERQPYFTLLQPTHFTKQLVKWLRKPNRECKERKPMVSHSSECSIKGESKATVRERKSALSLP